MTLSPELFTILMFAGLLAGLLLGHPLAFVLGGLAVLFAAIGPGIQAFGIVINRVWGLADSYVMVAIPIFVFMARLLSDSGITDRLFHTLRLLFGPIPGGLNFAVIIISVLLAATTGMVGASLAVMGVLALPAMMAYGYRKETSTGAIAAGGSLGILIPPSIMLVVMGGYASLSVGKLFAAALIPGLLLAVCYALYAGILCWIRPEYGPPVSPEERAQTSTGRLLLMLLKEVAPTMLLILGVLGSIFAGIATVTEAASIGALIALLIIIAYGRFNLRMLKVAVLETGVTTAMVMFVAIGATAFTGIFVAGGGMGVVQSFFNDLEIGRWGTFALLMFAVFIAGMFLDWLGVILICFPIFLPIAATLGFDKLWFVMMIAICLQTSFLTPPVGYALFYLKGVAPPGITTMHIYRGVVPFVLIILGVIGLCAVFPGIVTWLPGRIG
ncbi:C4-dicarboxylate ABC transporter [Tistrella bauzanensis]|uniref:TRAP transporter large permease protein n=1 Tax=Tistrella bauzanensis TaxID=657419 RepID=A0ABQ1J4Z9_9PROT|nr:TRAP transporter large permease subunit [Tistrella bauzanensis]GGB58926.1 C4-dicarboxylate ABC transporter [Tistrella bauzanensis]